MILQNEPKNRHSKNTQRSILHNKIFNELFVIQIFYFMGISYQAEKAK